jgi:hypothetical protein
MCRIYFWYDVYVHNKDVGFLATKMVFYALPFLSPFLYWKERNGLEGITQTMLFLEKVNGS